MSGTSEILEAFVVCVFCVCAAYGANAFLRSLSCGYVNIKGIAKMGGGWIAPVPLCSSIGNSTCLYLYTFVFILSRVYHHHRAACVYRERHDSRPRRATDRYRSFSHFVSLSLSSLVLWQLLLRTNGRPSSYLCVYIVTNVTIRPESNCQSLLDIGLSLSLSLKSQLYLVSYICRLSKYLIIRHFSYKQESLYQLSLYIYNRSLYKCIAWMLMMIIMGDDASKAYTYIWITLSLTLLLDW